MFAKAANLMTRSYICHTDIHVLYTDRCKLATEVKHHLIKFTDNFQTPNAWLIDLFHLSTNLFNLGKIYCVTPVALVI